MREVSGRVCRRVCGKVSTSVNRKKTDACAHGHDDNICDILETSGTLPRISERKPRTHVSSSLRSRMFTRRDLSILRRGCIVYSTVAKCNLSACTIALLAKPKAGKALLDHLLRAPPLEPLRHKLQPSEAAPTRRVMSVRRARGLGLGLGVRVGVGERYRNGGARKDVRLAAASLPPPSSAKPIAPAASVTPSWP